MGKSQILHSSQLAKFQNLSKPDFGSFKSLINCHLQCTVYSKPSVTTVNL